MTNNNTSGQQPLPPSPGSKSGLEPGKIAWVTWHDGPQVCLFRERREDPEWDHCIITHQLNGEWFTRGVDTRFVFPDLHSANESWKASMKRLRDDLNEMEL